MKKFRNLLLASALVAVALLIVIRLQAYQPPPTTASFTNTCDWYTGDWTNILKTNTCIRWTNFILSVDMEFTNACAGTLSVCYTVGPDWQMENRTVSQGARGWFSIPLTNSSLDTRVIWNTNIHMGSHGAWVWLYATNNSGQHLTNFSANFYNKSEVVGRKRGPGPL